MNCATPPPPEDKVAICQILVVEDEYIVAQDICAELASLGITVVGPAANLRQAVHLATTTEPLHGAFLDVNLGGEPAFPVADVLAKRNVPFVFTTGYDRSILPAKFGDAMQIAKPVATSVLETALRDMCKEYVPRASSLGG